jgi:DNA invertase Pin-like site-specific DNA recombinase
LMFNGNVSPFSRFQLSLLGAVAELEREIILERQREGIAEAKKAGKYKGRKRKVTSDQIKLLRDSLPRSTTKTKLALDLGISRRCLYKYEKEINEGKSMTMQLLQVKE